MSELYFLFYLDLDEEFYGTYFPLEKNFENHSFFQIGFVYEKLPFSLTLGIEHFLPRSISTYFIEGFELQEAKAEGAFRYAKLCFAQKTMFSFRDFVFWLNANTYREVQSLLRISSLSESSLEKELLLRSSLLQELLKLY